MLYIVVCVYFAAFVYGAPAPPDVPLEKQQPTVIPIVSQSDELEPNGTYHFSYETGNGIKREEISFDKKVPKAQGRSGDSNEGGESSGDDSDEIHVQMGSYSYTAPDGTLISVRYVADENGFRPIGDHIPRVPSAPGSSSGEKSGRALKAVDNAESESAPAAATEPATKTPAGLKSAALAQKPEKSSKLASTAPTESESSTKSSETESSTTEAGKGIEAASTTEGASGEVSTTETAKSTGAFNGASTTGASTPAAEASTLASDASTPAAEASTPVSDASTPASDASTPASDTSTPPAEVSTLTAEQSTPSAEASTTEAASAPAASA